MHKRTAHNDTEPIEEEQEAFFEPPPGKGFSTVFICVYGNWWHRIFSDHNVSAR